MLLEYDNYLKQILYLWYEMVTTLKYGAEKDSLSKLLERLNKRTGRGVNVKKYSGKLKLDKDSLSVQKDLRNEWE